MLAEARRLADRIRRDAEREAATIRREAASWASQTRAEAEERRDAVLEQLSGQRSLPAAAPVHRERPRPTAVSYDDIRRRHHRLRPRGPHGLRRRTTVS